MIKNMQFKYLILVLCLSLYHTSSFASQITKDDEQKFYYAVCNLNALDALDLFWDFSEYSQKNCLNQNSSFLCMADQKIIEDLFWDVINYKKSLSCPNTFAFFDSVDGKS